MLHPMLGKMKARTGGGEGRGRGRRLWPRLVQKLESKSCDPQNKEQKMLGVW